MLITRAPFLTAHWIAFTSASTSIRSSPLTTLATSSSADGAIPAIPIALSTPAAISPATKVPCPSLSTRAEPPTKLSASTILPANSGCVASIPESITATRTAASGGEGAASQKSKARVAFRCHCFNGSFGTQAAGRRLPSRSTYVAPGSSDRRGAVARSTTSGRKRREALGPGAERALQARQVGDRSRTDGVARRLRGGSEQRCREADQAEPDHGTSSCAESPSAKPCPGAVRAR